MILRNKKILIISPESWQHHFVSKHHYAVSLGQKGNTVFFLNPPSIHNRCLKTSFPNIFTIDYSPVIRGQNWLPPFLSKLFSSYDIKKLKKIAGTDFEIIWSFDPYRFQYLEQFNALVKIYYAADWHVSKRNEKRLADRVQIVLSPSKVLLDSIKTKTPRKFMGHAVANYFFDKTSPVQHPGTHRIKIGYVGNLHSKYIHLDLLKRTVAVNQEVDFIFVGGNLIHGLEAYTNVFFKESCDNREIPAFLNACDILFLCYDTLKYRVEASNSHKILEYLASGKAIVSTRIEEYLDKPELLYMPNDNEDLPGLLGDIIGKIDEVNDLEMQQKRRQFAQQYTYDNQLERVDRFLSELTRA